MYQLIWHELIWVIGIYYTIAVMYRHILIPYYPTAKENFELFCAFCKKFDSPVPVTFLTGIFQKMFGVHHQFEKGLVQLVSSSLGQGPLTYLPRDLIWRCIANFDTV